VEYEVEELAEGEDFWSSESDRKAYIDNLRKDFLAEMEKEESENKKASGGFLSALKDCLSEEMQDQFYILYLLNTSTLTERQQDELLDVFRDNSKASVDTKVLLDALNPHPVAKRLWGHRIRHLCTESTEYTKHFEEGGDSNFQTEPTWPKGMKQNLEHPAFNCPPLNPSQFNCAAEDLQHMKLLRLAVDYYEMDLNTVEGMAAFDLLVHTYDISPGDDTLERTHPSPPDHHTYEELPIIKFDGWEECDEPEEEEEYEEDEEGQRLILPPSPKQLEVHH